MNSMAQGLESLLFGLTLPLRSAQLLLKHPKLLAASLVPWLLGLALDIWLVHRLQSLLAGWIQAYTSGTWETIALVLSWVAIVIAGVLVFSFVAAIVALPFNDFLAEMTESRATPPLTPVGGISWFGRARLLSIDLFKTICTAVMSLLALVMSWLPVLNLIGMTLAFLLIAFQFLSFPQTRRSEGVLAGILFIARNFWACVGFGVSFAFLFAIPLVSSVALPLAVVGGTLLYARGISPANPAKPAR